MIITVIDTETTGMGPQDQVIELAAAVVLPSYWVRPGVTNHLYWPTVPISFEAMAVHHLTSRDLSGQAEAARAGPPGPITEGDVLAFHNAAFDLRMIEQTWPGWTPPADVICTYRCARHAWPQAPGYSNQVLRYWLDLQLGSSPEMSLPPHRAAHDAFVTAHILCRLLADHPPDELIRLTATPILLPLCPIGDYRGKPWAEVPMSMIDWIIGLPDADPDLLYTATQIKQDPKRVPLLLPTITFGKHRGLRWADAPSSYLGWVLSQDFDTDTRHTADHHLHARGQ